MDFSLVNFDSLALPVVILVSFTAWSLLVSRDWRVSVAALAVQYSGMFILVALDWPVVMAVVKLVTGWIVGAVLGSALIGAPGGRDLGGGFSFAGSLFRTLATVLVALIALSLAPSVVEWIPGIAAEQVFGALILIGLGLLHLGLSAQPIRVTLGLLTMLSGFEILYAVVESSTLVAGLLAGVNLGVAFVGAYLLAVPELEIAE